MSKKKRTARNDITNAKIQTKPNSQTYRDGWERIFKQRKKDHAKKLEKITKPK